MLTVLLISAGAVISPSGFYLRKLALYMVATIKVNPAWLPRPPPRVLFRPRWQQWLTRPPTGEMKQSVISNARITGGVKLSGLGNRRNVERDTLTFFGKYSSPSLPQESHPTHNPSYEWNNIIIGHMKQTLKTTFLSWTTRQSDTRTTHTMLQ